MTRKNKKIDATTRQSGFTVVELLLVIAIIAVLAAISYVGYGMVVERAKASTLKHSLSQARHALLTYTATDPSENYPTALSDIGIENEGGVTFQYSYDNSSTPKTFCITATSDSINYKISSAETNPTKGACQGHSQQTYYTAGGWTLYPIQWSSGEDRGYGPYYGVYFPSNLKPENSGQLTLFNPYALTSAQGGVNTYLYCKNTSTDVITKSNGPTFATFNSSTLENTISWSCPSGSVLYALNIGSTNSTNDPDELTGSAKNRTWYSEASPNHVPSEPYAAPTAAADPEGWVSSDYIRWGGATYSDLGYGPYYGVYFANDPNKNLEATQAGTLQLHNPYAPTRAQGGVRLGYWCKNTTTGLVSNKYEVTFSGTFDASSTTKEVGWSCPNGSILFAAVVSSTVPSTYFPNLIADKTRYWFSGESVSIYPSYLDSLRTRHN